MNSILVIQRKNLKKKMKSLEGKAQIFKIMKLFKKLITKNNSLTYNVVIILF